MASDCVYGVIDRARLPSLLTAIHRQGFGHLSRVLDPSRGPFERQLAAAGLALDAPALAMPADHVLVAIHAAARESQARVVLAQHGATTIAACSAKPTGLPGLSADLATLVDRPRQRATRSAS